MNSSNFNNIFKFITPLGSSIIEPAPYTESFENNEDNVEEHLTKKKQIMKMAYFIFFIILGLLSAILCWRANTQTFLLLKILYVIFAYFFAPVYMVYYILYYCIFLKLTNKSNNIYSIDNNSSSIMKNTLVTNSKQSNMPNSYIADNISVTK